MPMYLRGQQGVLDLLTDERTKLDNRLENDELRREQGVSHMTKAQRATHHAEIGMLNYLIAILSNAVVLTDEGYDELSGRFTPATRTEGVTFP